MILLPIVARELRVASRRKGAVALRFFTAAMALLVVLTLLLGSSPTLRPQELARRVFDAISVIAFGVSLIAGVFLTADCLCSERREGTLGLLFLTDLKGYDVVFGKLAATSVVALYAFLAVIPMLGLPLLMGGVSFGEFLRVTLVVLITFLLSLASGILASALSRDTREAMLFCFGIMLTLTGVLYLLGWIVSQLSQSNANQFLWPSPLLAFKRTSDFSLLARGGLRDFWGSVLTLLGLAILQVTFTCVWISRRFEDRDAPKQGKIASAMLNPSRVDDSPFRWLLARDRFPNRPTCAVMAALFALWSGFYLGPFLSRSAGLSQPSELLFVTAFFIAAGLHIIVKGLMAVQAGKRFSEDRHNGALELLLTTPLTPEKMLSDHWHLLRRQFRWLMLALVAVNLALVWIVTLGRPFRMTNDDAAVFSAFFVGGIVLLWVDFYAIGWIGMWGAVRALRPQRAVLQTLGRVLVPPWVAVFLFAFLASGSRRSMEEILIWWGFWLVLSIGSAHVALARPRRELQRHFRALAAGESVATLPPTIASWPPAKRHLTGASRAARRKLTSGAESQPPS